MLACCVTKKLQREAASKGIRTFNSDIDWWSIDWYVDENYENMPKLEYYTCNKNNCILF